MLIMSAQTVRSSRLPCSDVLDQFPSAHDQFKSQPNVEAQQPTPLTSGPGRPSPSGKTTIVVPSSQSAAQTVESEDDFMARLASEMSSVLGNLDPNPSTSKTPTEKLSTMDKEFEQFTSTMEKQGVKPEDLLKAILDDAAGGGNQPANGVPTAPKAESSNQKPTARPDTSSGEKESFDETIRRTMERMQASDSHATNAATNPTRGTASEEDMLATLLKAMESPGGGDDTSDPNSDDSLSKMFLGMMEQLTNKDMLYEPMKELDTKYPEWLANNKGKLPDEDYKRYEGQRAVVTEIVIKFEEKGYSDDDPRCREFIWERMQKMQGMGSPPEDLIVNPFPGMLDGSAGGAGKEDDAGCPPQ